MEENSRTVNTIKNMTTGVISKIILLVLNFVSRTIFIKTLGVEYLGVNGLYSNILTILSLADLGFGIVILFSFYKPIVENDTKKITALMNFNKKIYHTVALVVTVIGIAFVPILPYIIKSDLNTKELIIYYLLYLANVVISYLFVYKTSILSANQKEYILTLCTFSVCILQQILQISILVLTHNFILFLCIQIFCTLLNNIIRSCIANKLYPYIKNKEKLGKEEEHKILDDAKSMFVYRIGNVILDSTDNILISAIIGTVFVGYYSNYSMVVTSVLAFINIIFNSIYSSIGNLNASCTKEKQYSIFKVVDTIVYWINTFCALSFFILFSDFIYFWLGEEFVLPTSILIIIVINFYVSGMIRAVSIFRDTTGIFKQTKYVFLIAAVINLILSIILGKILGLFGILVSTSIARLMTSVWYEPYVLFKKHFNKSFKLYLVKQIKYILGAISICCLTYLVTLILPSHSICTFILKIILCTIVPNVILFLVFHKTQEFNYIYEHIIMKSINLLNKKKESIN